MVNGWFRQEEMILAEPAVRRKFGMMKNAATQYGLLNKANSSAILRRTR